MSALEQFELEYHHTAKLASPQPSLTLGAAVLKWYDIAPEDAAVPIAIRAVARRCLRDAAKSGALDIGGDCGFVILHRCANDFYFLLVSTWRNENELWETVWAKRGVSDVFFGPWPTEGTHRPTFCVWELGVVAHERLAWTRFLRSAHDEAARRAYLGDLYVGDV
ncbi:MAG TPA: hypothetical protein VFU99_05520 [Gaiellaceae bacterium]|nr:hypothetical protein [Gaiellaceae bacterium]